MAVKVIKHKPTMRKGLIPRVHIMPKIDVPNTAHMEGFQCPGKNINVKLARSLDILLDFVFRKSKLAPNPGDLKCNS